MTPRLTSAVTLVLALICGLPVAACRNANYIVVGVSDANTDVIARVEWSGGSRSVLLSAGDAGQVIALDAAPRDPQLVVMDPASCEVLGQIKLVQLTNWFSVENSLGPNQVYDGPIVLADGPKGIEPGEFSILAEDRRCAATAT